jgi:hypothetical protein
MWNDDVLTLEYSTRSRRPAISHDHEAGTDFIQAEKPSYQISVRVHPRGNVNLEGVWTREHFYGIAARNSTVQEIS